MKKVSLLLLAMLSYCICFSQTDVKKNKLHSLQIGEQMPDLPLGKIMDNKGNVTNSFQGKTSFSKFKGKLIILDFWRINCASCIEGFAKMSELQKKFKDKIQIFLVNYADDEKKINAWLKRANKNRNDGNIVPQNLPIVADAQELKGLFPPDGEIGYHAWINTDGKVVLRGISDNTYDGKIEDQLSGRKITFIKDGSPNAYNDRLISHPFFIKDLDSISGLEYASVFSGFQDEAYYGASGSLIENTLDSISGTVRTSAINQSILKLYQIACARSIKNSQILFGHRVLIEVSDTSVLNFNDRAFSPDREKAPKTDVEFRKRKFSYEQIAPMETSRAIKNQMMLEDLNRYFGRSLGIIGGLERRELSCYKLIVVDQLELAKHTVLDENSQSFSELLKNYFYGAEFNKKLDYTGWIINDTELSNKIDLQLPRIGKIESLEALRKNLQKYGLDLVSGKKITEILVIKDVSPKKSKVGK